MKNHSSKSIFTILVLIVALALAFTDPMMPSSAIADDVGGVPIMPIQHSTTPDSTFSDTLSTSGDSGNVSDETFFGQLVEILIEVIY